jgi:hypothetical protein
MNRQDTQIVGLIQSAQDVVNARQALKKSGFQYIQVYYGASALNVLNGGCPSGFLGNVKQRIMPNKKLDRTTTRAIRAGHRLMVVKTDGSLDSLNLVRQLLIAHHAHSINYVESHAGDTMTV